MEKTIGQGTYGKVKLAHHVQTKEKVAIKVIDKATIENDRQVKRIQKEIRFLKVAQLTSTFSRFCFSLSWVVVASFEPHTHTLSF